MKQENKQLYYKTLKKLVGMDPVAHGVPTRQMTTK